MTEEVTEMVEEIEEITETDKDGNTTTRIIKTVREIKKSDWSHFLTLSIFIHLNTFWWHFVNLKNYILLKILNVVLFTIEKSH